MNAVTESLIKIFERDLNKLEEEIRLFPSEKSLWKIQGEVKNSAGNLCLHLCGNLQYYVGAIIGNIAYHRNRDNEFAAKNVPRQDLISEIQRSKKAVRNSIEKLDNFLLEQEYPLQLFSDPMTNAFFLIHLAAHLSYHLGQINYLRRMLS